MNKKTKSQRSKTDTHREKLAREKQFYEEFYSGRFSKRAKQKRTAFEKVMISLLPTLPDNSDRLVAALGKTENLEICELGCGHGKLTATLARDCRVISAQDISRNAVKMANSRVRDCDLHNVNLLQMDAYHLCFRDESFDLVVGKEILHHLEVGIVAKEINRVLKKGGKAIFVEPLAHNPISNLWRKLTPTDRTTDEWPLSYAEIQEIGVNFRSTTCKEFCLLAFFSSFVYLITHSTRAKWKTGEILSRAEDLFLTKSKLFSGVLRRLCANVLVQFTK